MAFVHCLFSCALSSALSTTCRNNVSLTIIGLSPSAVRGLGVKVIGHLYQSTLVKVAPSALQGLRHGPAHRRVRVAVPLSEDERVELFGDLRYANLSGANLYYADLARVDFTGAHLNGANLKGVYLRRSHLRDADVTGATLYSTNFSYADLQDADFATANLGSTVFANTDLSHARGFDSVRHDGPSEISISTLHKSGGNIPEAFLRGCDLKDWEIEAARLYRLNLSPGQATEILYKVHELRTNPAIQLNSCFISYSSKNLSFAENLYEQLQDIGVRCWFAPEHIKIGDKFRQRIDEAIRFHDKLLLVLSEDSMASAWVENEVEAALEREIRENRLVLFPVRIDDAIEQSNTAWAASLRRMRHIGDFSKWKDYDSYSKVFERLLHDLKSDSKA